MAREIIISVISGIIGSMITVFGGASLGWYDQYIKDTQVQLLSDQIVNEPRYRDTLIDKMDKSGKFIGKTGPQGLPGLQGRPGSQGAIPFDANLGPSGAFVFTADNGYVIHWTTQGWFCIYAPPPNRQCFNVGSKM